ncbi:Permease of the drug/metabolite transporter (DMT) superfamily [Flavobacterium glycines]|uniref:Drug/metabolite exporter YedA n=1 Tax=Flavobacterium glycines TaxID=551990 RepID=A0A511CDC6_9FLAO|nr:EamA family transporter [Flavobacterium glycines]GEL10549.1 drug/metabolite exporter YedA [Flavobacterium glycines]SDI63635.1 Permease of the drug/metabolite transporter (DMT) superfamily [Flavobacterium glycines]
MIQKIKTAVSTKINAIGLPILALLWVGFFWGTTWIASKEGVRYIPGIQMAAIRQFLAGALYIIYLLFTKSPWPKGKQWKTIVILAILNFTLSNGLSTAGVKYISSGLGAIIAAIFPIWVVIISYFRGERIAKLAVTGVFICFSGVCIIFYEYLADFLKPDFQLGIILSVLATITWAFGTLYTKKKAASYNPYFSLGFQMFISSILLFAYNGATGISVSLNEIPMSTWIAIAYLVVVGSLITFTIFIYSLQHLPPELSSLYAYMNPVVAVLLGSIIFGESLSISIAIGGMVTLFGLYLVNKSLRQSRKKTNILIK